MGRARRSFRTTAAGGGVLEEGQVPGTVTLDRQIAAALQLNGRATWREIAHLLHSSESTVARRARALMAAGVIRTTAIAEPLRCGFGYPVLCRLECLPERMAGVARQLAERPDVRFAALVTGPFDVIAELIVGSRDDLARVLVDEVAAIPGLMRTTTENILRTFKMSYDWSRALLEPVAPVPAPAPIDVRAPLQPVTLDAVDLGVIDLLREDGRRSYQDVAAALGISESAGRRRVDHLIGSGCVTPVTLVDPPFLGYDVELFVFLRVDPPRLEEVAAALAGRPEVRYLSATSGYSDLVAEVILRSRDDDLYRFRTGVLGSLPGIQHVDMALELRTLKRAHLRMDGHEELGNLNGGKPT